MPLDDPMMKTMIGGHPPQAVATATATEETRHQQLPGKPPQQQQQRLLQMHPHWTIGTSDRLVKEEEALVVSRRAERDGKPLVFQGN